MSNTVYPSYVRGLGFTVFKEAEWSTVHQAAPGGQETRIAQYQNPMWHYELIYNYLKDISNDLPPGGIGYTDLASLIGFFNARQGDFDDFLFDDPDDDFVGPGVLTGGAPNPAAQLPLVTDGTTYYSPIQRILGGQAAEDVTDLIPSNAVGSITVWSNGSIIPNAGNWTIGGPGLAIAGSSYGGLYVQWDAMPTAPITAQFSYYHRLRFDGSTVDFEKFLYQVWTMGGPAMKNGTGYLKLVTSRPQTNI